MTETTTWSSPADLSTAVDPIATVDFGHISPESVTRQPAHRQDASTAVLSARSSASGDGTAGRLASTGAVMALWLLLLAGLGLVLFGSSIRRAALAVPGRPERAFLRPGNSWTK